MDKTVQWLLEGDVSIQYLVHRWLMGADANTLDSLQNRMVNEGFVSRLLSCRNADGQWGLHYYQKKWTCTHYTLLLLQSLCAPRSLQPCREMVSRMLDECMLEDGSLNLSKYRHPSDPCVDGMALTYCAYFCPDDSRVVRLARHLISCQKADGGFTWDWSKDASEPHTTICVLEGFGQFLAAGLKESEPLVRHAREKAVGFLLSNRLFMDHPDSRFQKLSFPYRYRYDLLRTLDCFADQGLPAYLQTRPALEWLRGKQRPDGLWVLENIHKGNEHFIMEERGKPSRFITIRALHILEQYPEDVFVQ